MKLRTLIPFLCGLGIVLLATSAQAATFVTPSTKGGSVTQTKAVTDDAFLAGNSTVVTAPIAGELFAAGNSVSIDSTVGRSVFAVGNTVSISQGSSYNTYAAGNTVTLSGTYGHDVYVAGSTVIIKPGTVINGELRMAGRDLVLSGTVKGNVYASGTSVTSDAIIGGTLKGWGGDFAFTGGSIAGDFTYQSLNDATGLDTVKVSGTTNRTEPPAQSDVGGWFKTAAVVFMLSGTLILLLFLILFVPKNIEDTYDEWRDTWASSFLRGLAILVLTPLAIGISFGLIVGWQVAVILGLLYVGILLVAHAVSYVVLGHYLWEFTNQQGNIWISALLGLVVGFVLMHLPHIGFLFMLAWFFGLMVPTMGALVSRRGSGKN